MTEHRPVGGSIPSRTHHRNRQCSLQSVHYRFYNCLCFHVRGRDARCSGPQAQAVSFFLHKNVMAAVDSLLNAAPPVPPENVTTQQPFASITAYFFSKTDTSPVWTIGFRCRSDQNYKAEGALVFCTNDKCKNSAGLPAGHKNEFPFFRKWKKGDSNQIMLLHYRNTHGEELAALVSKTKDSVGKAAPSQKDLRTMIQTKNPVVFIDARQRALNKAVVYNSVIHDKMPLSRFNSAGFSDELARFLLNIG